MIEFLIKFMAEWIWLGLLVLFLAVEASTVALVSLWFAVGALAALLTAAFGGNVILQVAAFLAVSVALLVLARPILRRYVNPKIIKTNAESVVGTVGLVTEAIDNLAPTGQVKLGGMFWTARSVSGDKIPVGTQIRVERIEGVKVLVSPVPELSKI